MHDFINKEIDAWVVASKGIPESGKEFRLRAALERAYAEGLMSDSHDVQLQQAYEKARTDLIAELVGKVREEKKNWNDWHDGHLPASQKDNVKGFNTALDRAIEIINNAK